MAESMPSAKKSKTGSAIVQYDGALYNLIEHVSHPTETLDQLKHEVPVAWVAKLDALKLSVLGILFVWRKSKKIFGQNWDF